MAQKHLKKKLRGKALFYRLDVMRTPDEACGGDCVSEAARRVAVNRCGCRRSMPPGPRWIDLDPLLVVIALADCAREFEAELAERYAQVRDFGLQDLVFVLWPERSEVVDYQWDWSVAELVGHMDPCHAVCMGPDATVESDHADSDRISSTQTHALGPRLRPGG